MRRAAVALARKWWPEFLCVALLAAIGAAGQKDDPLFAVFVAIMLAIGWGLGRRHGNVSLHRKIDRLTDGFTGLAGELRGQEAEPKRPRLTVVPPAS